MAVSYLDTSSIATSTTRCVCNQKQPRRPSEKIRFNHLVFHFSWAGYQGDNNLQMTSKRGQQTSKQASHSRGPQSTVWTPYNRGQQSSTQAPHSRGQQYSTQAPHSRGQPSSTQVPHSRGQQYSTQVPHNGGQQYSTQIPHSRGQQCSTQVPHNGGQQSSAWTPYNRGFAHSGADSSDASRWQQVNHPMPTVHPSSTAPHPPAETPWQRGTTAAATYSR